jgi:hypothetical protein
MPGYPTCRHSQGDVEEIDEEKILHQFFIKLPRSQNDGIQTPPVLLRG